MHPCGQLRRESDQVRCLKCGRQWDISDPEPPACVTVHAARLEYLSVIKKLFGVEGVKK